MKGVLQLAIFANCNTPVSFSALCCQRLALFHRTRTDEMDGWPMSEEVAGEDVGKTQQVFGAESSRADGYGGQSFCLEGQAEDTKHDEQDGFYLSNDCFIIHEFVFHNSLPP